MNIWNHVNSILIVGARGMLGREVVDALKHEPWKTKIRAGLSDGTGALDGGGGAPEIFAMDLDEIDITKSDSVTNRLASCRPQLVVNCAAYTDVDGCETDRETAWAVNGAGPGNLASACRAIDAKLVHISTDFVFDGQAKIPYKPDDPTGPLSVYGQSKLAGEQAVRQALDNHLIIRTSWLFGQYGKNFVRTIRRIAGQGQSLRVVDDQ
ncbi:MAG: sugar nucleotide-binding protein, partial [Sedimentisphaerales bacterium]|nr:sugar nucleotide-binding protein [Sedimentisphaerales bacterium]